MTVVILRLSEMDRLPLNSPIIPWVIYPICHSAPLRSAPRIFLGKQVIALEEMYDSPYDQGFNSFKASVIMFNVPSVNLD